MAAPKTYKVETKQFQGTITPTDGGHIFAAVEVLTVRGIDYNASAHFHKWPTGAWGIGLQGEPPSTTFYRQLYVTRRSHGYSSKTHDVSHAARVKIAEILTAELVAWLEDNQQALVQAQQDDTAREIDKREEKIGELRAEIATLESEIASLQKQAAQ
jgi:hypothetical protein